MSAKNDAIFMNSKLVGKVIKSRMEEVRVNVLRNNVVDVRSYMYLGDDDQPRPTKRGVWLSYRYLPEIINKLEEFSKDQTKPLDIEFEKSNMDKIKVYNNEFRGKKLVHIRTYYMQGEEFKPGKGVSFSVNLLLQVLDLLKKANELKE